LLDRMVAVLDDAVLEHPGLAARMLEVEIGGVDRRPGQAREYAFEVAGGKAAGPQQPVFGLRDEFGHVDKAKERGWRRGVRARARKSRRFAGGNRRDFRALAP